jgi:hypothetical protein
MGMGYWWMMMMMGMRKVMTRGDGGVMVDGWSGVEAYSTHARGLVGRFGGLTDASKDR